MRVTRRILAIVTLTIAVSGCAADRGHQMAPGARTSSVPAPQTDYDDNPSTTERPVYPDEPPMVPPSIGVSRVKRVGFLTEVRSGFVHPFASQHAAAGCCEQPHVSCPNEGCVTASAPHCRPWYRCRLLQALRSRKKSDHSECCVEPPHREMILRRDTCGEHAHKADCGECGLIAPDGFRPLRSSAPHQESNSGSLAERLEDPFLHDAPAVPEDSQIPAFPLTSPLDLETGLPAPLPPVVPALPQSAPSNELPLWPRHRQISQRTNLTFPFHGQVPVAEPLEVARPAQVPQGILIRATERATAQATDR